MKKDENYRGSVTRELKFSFRCLPYFSPCIVEKEKIELPSQDHDSSPRNSLLAGSMLLFGYVLAKEDDIFWTQEERGGEQHLNW